MSFQRLGLQQQKTGPPREQDKLYRQELKSNSDIVKKCMNASQVVCTSFQRISMFILIFFLNSAESVRDINATFSDSKHAN